MLIQDAAEYAGLAAKKRLFFLKAGRLARSVEEVRNATQRDPVAEVAAMLVVRARWHRPEPQLGCALIRRTWSHNLVIDFLFNDPNLLRPEAPNIRGVATGLLFFTMSLGQILGAGRFWGEATDQSAGFYRRQFRDTEINDQFNLTPAEQWHFLEKTRAKWCDSALPLKLEITSTLS